MVEFIGAIAHLSQEEQRATCLPSPIAVLALDAVALWSRVKEIENFVDARTAEEDTLSNADRGHLFTLRSRLVKDRHVVTDLAARITAQQTTLFLEKQAK